MKTKRILSLVLAVILSLSVLSLGVTAESAQAPTLVTTASGWDGTTATAPEGDGSVATPYLITSAANLKWIADNIVRGNDFADDADGIAAGNYRQSFAGKYFKQMQDIDLNGRDFKSIGYYFDSKDRMAGFGGIYDGAGYAITNGKIVSAHSSCGDNFNWATGLFGVIYNATVKNVTLDGVIVEGSGVIGGIVGRAGADWKSAADPANNLVENCVLNDNCVIQTNFATTEQMSQDSTTRPGIAGGIVGFAQGITVKNCTNRAAMEIIGGYVAVGGIVGRLNFGVVVDGCVNSGAMNITNAFTKDGTTTYTKGESAFGGIAGFLGSAYECSKAGHEMGTVAIRNCYHLGTVQYTTESFTTSYWGGILGGAQNLKAVSGNAEAYVIENCHNLNPFAFFANTNCTKSQNFRVGGLVGCIYCNDVNAATLFVKNSTSVDVEENWYTGSNECRYSNFTTKTDGLMPVSESGNATKSINEILNASDLLVVAEAPAGLGTQAEPYLIKTAGNLQWLAEQTFGTKTVAKPYCKQTVDIDLGNKILYSIGSSTSKYFEGVYDGQGYSVKNGTVMAPDASATFKTLDYGYGLFGMIKNATVKNIVLDDLTVVGWGLTGGVVGRAIADAAADGKTYSSETNLIQNCVVLDTCSFAVGQLNPSKVSGNIWGEAFGGAVAGIVGAANGTTVSGCINYADIKATCGYVAVGGIAGAIDVGTTVSSCANYGKLIDFYNWDCNDEQAFGGIVGRIHKFISASATDLQGAVKIEGCVNNGGFEHQGSKNARTAYWGGILGGGTNLRANLDQMITGCHNANAKLEGLVTGRAYRYGGLLGCVWNAAGQSQLKIRSSTTVMITADVKSDYTAGNNAYQCNNVADTVVVYYADTQEYKTAPGGGDNTLYGGLTVKSISDASVVENTVAAAAETIRQSHLSVVVKGYQKSTAAGDRFDLRFVCGVETLAWENVGVELYINGEKIGERTTTTVFNSYLGAGKVYTAEDHSSEYLALIALTNLPTVGSASIELRVFGTDTENVRSYGNAYTFRIENGTVIV